MMLRDYQEKLVKGLRSSLKLNNKILAVLPTGGGKTYTFSYIVKRAWEKGVKVCILTDRIELLTQASGALSDFGITPIKIMAGKAPNLNNSLYVAMSETLKRRCPSDEYKDFVGSVQLWIIDEAHKRSFTKLFDYINPKAKVIGFTATPDRIGKKDQLHENYKDIVKGVEIKYLIDKGWLSVPKYYNVPADLNGVKTVSGDYDRNEVASRFSTSKLYAGVLDNWKTLVPNTKTLIFSSNVESSLEISREFSENGIECRHLDATMKSERKSTLEWFKNTPNGVLSNVGILTTGFDDPSVETIILYRATKSLSLYLQMVGRGSRVTDTKNKFNVLDFGNNIVTHGFWHEEREWDLDPKVMASKNAGTAVLKNCKGCEAFIAASAVTCKFCGHVDKKEKKKQEIVRLQLLDPKELMKEALAGTLEDKVKLCKQKLVKTSWVLHQLRTYSDVLKFLKLMGYHHKWLEHNHGRYWFADIYRKTRKRR